MRSKTTTPLWKNKKVIPIILQVIFIVVVVLTGIFLIANAIEGLNRIGLRLGFDFLKSTASFAIDDKLIQYTPSDSFGRALLVGLLNTLKIGVIGVIFAGILGLFIGIWRLSDNWLINRLAGAYVELIRNTPLLIQIFFLYFAILLPLPKIENNVHLFNIIFLSNRGTAIPWFNTNQASVIWLVLIVLGLVAAVVLRNRMMKKQIDSGKKTYPMFWFLGSLLVAAIIAFAATSRPPLELTVPRINNMIFEGGYVISSEFAAILFGLIIYHSAFIAEIVRGGILAVPKGQIEAAKALGFKKGKIMRLVILPQALRIIIPSVTSQFLNLFKNSTLAIAVGFTDLFSIGNTIINQTGRAIEIMVIIASIYLVVSLVISFFMNWFNKHYQLVER